MTDDEDTSQLAPRPVVGQRRATTADDQLPPPSIAGESVLGDRAEAGPGTDRTPPMIVGSAEPLGIDTLDEAPPVLGAGQTSLPGATGKTRRADRIFRGLSTGAGLVIIAVVVLIAVFLIAKAWPALAADKSDFLLSRDWSTDTSVLHFGIVDLLWGTVAVSLIAMVLALPISIGIALFITQYAPRRLAKPVAYVIDLLAAIPSIVYGIWGITVLAPRLTPVQRALYHLSFIPFFKNQNVATGTIFDAGIVLAIMILPIMTAIARDVFNRTPRHNIEAAWALGATRWEMIRLAVLPYGRPGVISGAMLGLGRALGETVAMYLILSAPATGAPFTPSVFNGAETFASKIANNAAEFESPKAAGAYIAAGLVLFVLTFLVNAAARAIVNRRKEFS
ncbi:MAG TPA: phosphate ABC transporter permease subunit PstC [Jatrophihabitantaceae bacterium]|jgi:phosphate transport system permease protein|nr:phosphate ABC transporter permease subunit PstC [Jatrophihabitantaceae bacterium]